jgi:hypothetical protein
VLATDGHGQTLTHCVGIVKMIEGTEIGCGRSTILRDLFPSFSLLTNGMMYYNIALEKMEDELNDKNLTLNF